MDFIGLNYYVGMRVEGMEASILPELSPLFTLNPLTIDTSLLIPRGLYEILDLLDVRYGKPVYITENNGQEQWFGGGEAAEVRVIVQNWQWLLHAIAQGVDVRGYFYWSLLDNYEWNHGMDLPTGLYAVDPHDPQKTRTARERATVYGALCAARGVTPDVAAKAPADLDEAPTGGIPQEFRVPASQ
jgi:beta-glucosidase